MKLWKSKKSSSGTSCVPGKLMSSITKHLKEDKSASQSSAKSGDRAMSPAQSEDSGLATERGTMFAIISLPRDSTNSIGIVFTERVDMSCTPVIAAINPYGAASDFLAPGDRIHQIDGIPTSGLTNAHLHSILQRGEGPAVIEIEYCLPDYMPHGSMCVTTKLAQIGVERENNCFGLTLRGGGDCALIVTNVRPHGPAFKTGRIKPGDRLLRVNNISLMNKTLLESQQILRTSSSASVPDLTYLTIEYDVSVIQSIEFSLGALLIEIERPLNDSLGLILTSSEFLPHEQIGTNEVQPNGVYISSILPASIADRCGALSVGDQLLCVDDVTIENTNLTPDDVMARLEAKTNRGYTQLQIMPYHAFARRGTNNFNTIESRRNQHSNNQMSNNRKFSRKSSLPAMDHPMMLMQKQPQQQQQHHSQPAQSNVVGLCHSEIMSIVLDCSRGSGLVLAPQSQLGNGHHIISQIVANSVSDRCGCVFKGDRIVSINKLYNLEASVIRQILGDQNQQHGHVGTTQRGASIGSRNISPHWVELEIEFDMADSVIPSSGVFNVRLAKLSANACLGITVNANGGEFEGSSSVSNIAGSAVGSVNGFPSLNSSFVISEVKRGSPAHRTGSLRAGDILLAVDSHPLQHFNVDVLLKENRNDFTTLTIKRNCLPDFLFDAQQRVGHNIYSNVGGDMLHNCSTSVESVSNGDVYNNTMTKADVSVKAQSCQPELYSSVDSIQNVSLPTTLFNSMNSSDRTTYMRRPFATCTTENEHTDNLTTESDANILTIDGITEHSDDGEYHKRNRSFDSNMVPPPMESRMYGSPALTSTHQLVFDVRLVANGGPLGITLTGSEDLQKPILISALLEEGCAYKTHQICIGDRILAINGESLIDTPLSQVTHKLSQNIGSGALELKLARNICGSAVPQSSIITAQPQAVYAKVQRRNDRGGALFNDNASSSTSSSTLKCGSGVSHSVQSEINCRTFHVSLHKDSVYDDYGFSLSDGLYERGVFINRIRSGGPADVVGLLNPFDRIMQVNGVKTHDFDCCLTVPLIASAGDTIELLLERSPSVSEQSF